MLQANFPAYT